MKKKKRRIGRKGRDENKKKREESKRGEHKEVNIK